MLRYRRAIPLQLTLLLLAACAGASQEGQPQVSTVPPQEQTVPAAPIDQPTEPLQPTALPNLAPTLETLPTPRQDLHATNPATVQLAAGEPTLVEFFAFW